MVNTALLLVLLRYGFVERFGQAVSPFPLGSSLIICIRVRRLSGDPLECVVQMWRLPSLGQQRLGLFCVISAVRLTMVLQSMSFSVGYKHLLPWLPRGSCYQKS